MPFISFAVLLLLLGACSQKPTPAGITSISELKQLFADPPAEYRSAPLWDWNDDITEEGIDFQMQQFREAGIGGVFVHPRPGLITEYLSDEWFRLFDYSVKKGKELGMKVWIYDENSYPSGFAGGHVPAEMPDSYRHGSGLKMEILGKLDVRMSDTIALVLKKTGATFTDITATWEEEKGKTGTYYIFRKTYPAKSPWYGGFTYVDLLYPGVTEKFLELTMKKGYGRNRADFGQALPGVFTDEPNLEAAMSDGAMMRWTPDLWDAFKKRWGYDLRLSLPSLAEEYGDWRKVRHDYYELLLELFVDRWAKPWSAYCDENNLLWTGHYWEHGWPEPTDGSDEPAFYIWHQMPGIDMLGNRLDSHGLGGQFGNDRAVRELRSAANQAGRTRTLSETYGGGGWEMSFETQKRLVDWELALGVNFVNQHLSYYSLNGVRKFDYPPSFSYHEPWWKEYRLLGDYIGRISMAMSSGRQVNKTLVLQPNTTAWMYFSRKTRNPKINEIRKGFKSFVYRLEQAHIEYDLGSENVLKVLGSVSGHELQVGQCSYSLVVIPAELENIDRSTLEILSEYLVSGGNILSFARTIPYVDGAESQDVEQLREDYSEQWTSACEIYDPAAEELLSGSRMEINDISQNGMLYHQRRIMEDGEILFVVNSHPSEKAEAEFTLKGRNVLLLDAQSGRIFKYPSEYSEGKVTFRAVLDPAGSVLFAVSNDDSTEEKLVPKLGSETELAPLSEMKVARESDNILVINYLDLKTGKSEKKDVYFMDALTSLFIENGVRMGNPWQHKIQYKRNYLELDTLFGADSGFEAAYNFTIGSDLDEEALRGIKAVVERPGLWTVSVNGIKAEQDPGAYWIDKGFPVYKIGKLLRPGRNTLELAAPRMNILAELMPVYILGDFSLSPSAKGWEIGAPDIDPDTTWIASGMPFYSGKVSYSLSYGISPGAGTQYIIKLGRWNGTVASVKVNGTEAGLIAWQPYELDVTPLLKDGKNEITVTVTGSLKNTFGFFYQEPDNWIFGPWSWNSAPKSSPPAESYILPGYGLNEPFRLIETKAILN